jgi:hypothetical protein
MRSLAAVVGSQYTVSPTVTNAFHLTYSRLAVTRGVAGGIPNPVSVGVKMANIHPAYIDLAVSNHFTMGGGSNAPSIFHRNQYQLADDIDWIRNRQHFSFGVSYIPVDERAQSSAATTFPSTGPSQRGFRRLRWAVRIGNPAEPAEIGCGRSTWGYTSDDIKVNARLNVHRHTLGAVASEHDVAGRGNTFDGSGE